MRTLDRLVAILAGLIMAAFALAVFGVVSSGYFLDRALVLIEAWGRGARGGLAAIAFVALLIGIYLLELGFRTRRGPRAIIRGTSLGDVSISLAAIENLVRRAARQVRGIREVDTFVNASPEGIEVVLSVLVAPDLNIPEICDETQARLERYIRETVGVEATRIKVNVRNIATESRARVE
ncbi:MAG TPA: alkaline shock response membrane anchor protein AmaP [Firmicutes bacterium]|nr:alkaline shock response membrane anchor protein AmaP [Bacillota bacterium]